MNAKEFLNKAFRIKTALDVKTKALEDADKRFGEMLELSDQQEPQDGTGLKEAYAEMADSMLEPMYVLETEIKNLYKRYARLMEVISLVDDGDAKSLLLMRYILHMSINDISDELEVPLDRLPVLQCEAEQAVDKVLALKD